jgi:fructose-specific phosphotransferase system IIC component
MGLAVSTSMYLVGAAVTNIWVPDAFAYTLAGLFGGFTLGFVGLALTRWEVTPRSIHYTSNRLLVLTITLIVTARLVYGLWRTWHGWRTAAGTEWLAASGAAGALGAGAVVLGYYLVYWTGVRRRLSRLR